MPTKILCNVFAGVPPEAKRSPVELSVVEVGYIMAGLRKMACEYPSVNPRRMEVLTVHAKFLGIKNEALERQPNEQDAQHAAIWIPGQ